MTYKELRDFLNRFSDEELAACDVTVHDQEMDEFYPGESIHVEDESDIVDPGSFVIEMKGSIVPTE